MIKINKEYFIDSDSLNFILKKNVVSQKENKDYVQIVGFYQTLEQTLKGYLKYKSREFVNKKEYNSIEEYLNYIQEEDKKLKDILKGE